VASWEREGVGDRGFLHAVSTTGFFLAVRSARVGGCGEAGPFKLLPFTIKHMSLGDNLSVGRETAGETAGCKKKDARLLRGGTIFYSYQSHYRQKSSGIRDRGKTSRVGVGDHQQEETKNFSPSGP